MTVTTGAGAYELLVVQDGQGFKLVHPSGDEIATFEPSQLSEVLKRISRQVAAQALIDLKFPDQDFNATVEIPGNRGFLKQGEPFTIEFSAERDSHVLLVDIDNEGYVSVLYPFSAEEARPVRWRSTFSGSPSQSRSLSSTRSPRGRRRGATRASTSPGLPR